MNVVLFPLEPQPSKRTSLCSFSGTRESVNNRIDF